MALAQLFMPAFVLAMASGFAGDERLDLAVGMGRVVPFPISCSSRSPRWPRAC